MLFVETLGHDGQEWSLGAGGGEAVLPWPAKWKGLSAGRLRSASQRRSVGTVKPWLGQWVK